MECCLSRSPRSQLPPHCLCPQYTVHLCQSRNVSGDPQKGTDIKIYQWGNTEEKIGELLKHDCIIKKSIYNYPEIVSLSHNRLAAEHWRKPPKTLVRDELGQLCFTHGHIRMITAAVGVPATVTSL